jgi:hypothetical protein
MVVLPGAELVRRYRAGVRGCCCDWSGATVGGGIFGALACVQARVLWIGGLRRDILAALIDCAGNGSVAAYVGEFYRHGMTGLSADVLECQRCGQGRQLIKDCPRITLNNADTDLVVCGTGSCRDPSQDYRSARLYSDRQRAERGGVSPPSNKVWLAQVRKPTASVTNAEGHALLLGFPRNWRLGDGREPCGFRYDAKPMRHYLTSP